MVVFVNAGEIKDGRDAVFCKVVMIGAVVKTVGIVVAVIGVIQFEVCVLFVGCFVDIVEGGAEAI